ncbi:MAG TPA: response regulator transcription factor [Chloroflexia bacterium]|jgi:DNA-binding response OmpR family regulator|nr:response regulator transcription factor [Chloroflexia bacterium]
MGDKTILAVDDEPHILELVRLYLTQENYVVETARTGTEALSKFQAVKPALVVLDLMLPEIDGWEVCRRIRRESDVPIIMLTARSDDIDKIVGLELGADDYLTKPFNGRELAARVKVILRRVTSAEPPRQTTGALEFGNTRIDPARREVTIARRRVELRAKEFDLLHAFVQHLGLVLERDKLLNIVWGYEYFGDTRTVDVHVAHLRDRIAGSTLSLQTVRGIGYKMVEDDGSRED